MRLPGALLGLFLPFVTFAHHAVTAPFTDEEMRIDGVVLEFNFVNPHVNIVLNVTDENGTDTRWRATAAAPDSLRRFGWSEDSIEVGQRLLITGMKSRYGRPMLLVEREHWNDGGMLVLDPDDGSLLHVLEGTPSRIDDGPVLSQGPLAPTLDDGRPNISGFWSKLPSVRAANGSPGRNSPPLNERAQTEQDNFDLANDPSYTGCAAHGLVRQASTVKPLHIAQYEDRVVFNYEEGAVQRVVHLDESALDHEADKSNLGVTTARYENDTLVIESTALLANLSNIFGSPLSDQHTTVEQYRRGDDEIGPALELLQVATE